MVAREKGRPFVAIFSVHGIDEQSRSPMRPILCYLTGIGDTRRFHCLPAEAQAIPACAGSPDTLSPPRSRLRVLHPWMGTCSGELDRSREATNDGDLATATDTGDTVFKGNVADWGNCGNRNRRSDSLVTL
jgi:hypothetical protein